MSVATQMTFRNITTMMKNIIYRKSNTRVPLGRWGVAKNDTSCNLTIDYSNEDHCGVCNDYLQIKVIKMISMNMLNITNMHI